MRLEQLLRNQCELYNAALEERRGAWKWERRSVSYFDQTRTLTTLRELRPEVLEHGVTVCRGTLKRLDRAFCAFYRRCRAGQTPGFPRFISEGAQFVKRGAEGSFGSWTEPDDGRGSNKGALKGPS
jgi:putative transposase